MLLERFLFTVHKRSCGKVMFLDLSVILFTGGVSASVHAGKKSEQRSGSVDTIPVLTMASLQ